PARTHHPSSFPAPADSSNRQSEGSDGAVSEAGCHSWRHHGTGFSMRFRRTLAEPEEAIELNLIPLIDVIMFLLIFFISTTSFIEEPGVQVDKPQAATASQLDKNSIIFAITPDGKVA